MSEWAKKRFWKTALVEEQESGFAVLLDGRFSQDAGQNHFGCAHKKTS